jgi:hypothetical protein
MAQDKARFTTEMVDDVSGPARRARSSLDRLRDAFDKFNRSSVGKAAARFAGVAKDVLAVGASIGAGVSAAVGAMTVQMVDFNQRTRLGFQALAAAGEDPQKSLEDTIALIKRFGFNNLRHLKTERFDIKVCIV